jgi:hypothetical protein
MLRPYFLHHRELLGEMARLAYDTVREVMAAKAPIQIPISPELLPRNYPTL